MKNYTEHEGITSLAGDTFGLHVAVTDAEGVEGLTVSVIVLSVKSPDRIVLSKPCPQTEDGYTVQFTTSDTAQLAGDYLIDVIVTGVDNAQYKRARIPLTVMRSAKGAL